MAGKSKVIRKLMIDFDMTGKDLAEKLNISPSSLSKKLNKDDFLESELEEIAKVYNLKYVSYFVNKDGEKY